MDRDTICLWVVVALVTGVVWIIYDGKQNEEHKRYMLARRFCVKCGYNVHASKGRCPECGEPIEGSDET